VYRKLNSFHNLVKLSTFRQFEAAADNVVVATIFAKGNIACDQAEQGILACSSHELFPFSGGQTMTSVRFLPVYRAMDEVTFS
jgi:hypothetical protein